VEVKLKTKIIYSTFSCLLFLGMAMPGAAFANEHGQHYTATYNGTVLDTPFDPNGDTFPVNVVRGSGKGIFGQSDTVIVTEFAPDVTGTLCESQDDFRQTVDHAHGVSTYSMGEQLYISSVEGYLCLDLKTGDFEGLATGEFDGGTGRFANAHGNWESRFSGRNLTVPAGLPYGFGSINGITTGTLYLK
jgi:hypothetical protein